MDKINPIKEKEFKLKNFLCLVKNKRNRQYSFVLKKKALYNFGLSPEKILNMEVPKNKLKVAIGIKK